MQVRPLWLPGHLRNQEYIDRVTQAVHTWQQSWGLTGLTVTVEHSQKPRPGLKGDDWQMVSGLDGEPQCWLLTSAGLARQLSQYQWADAAEEKLEASGPISQAVTRQQLHALEQALVTALLGAEQNGVLTTSSAPPAQVPADKGLLYLSISLLQETVTCCVALPAPALRREADAPLPAPIIQAVQEETISLVATLGHQSLTLGQLASLAIGDVIRLPLALDQPIQIQDEYQTSLCPAHLGQQDGMMAVELMRPTTHPNKIKNVS